MIKKIIKILSLTAFLLIITFTLSVYSFAQPQHGYRISDYEVIVKVIKNGDLDVTEKVKYSSLGNSNNAVILIDKPNGEEIEIEKVYTLIRDELIECERLSAGQWDANVFDGTYSVLQENNLVRLKVYGTFKKQRGTVIVHYNVKNSVKRYGDIALFSRNHILRDWNGYAYNLDIEIQLPKYTDASRIKPFLHGVLVGQKRVLDGKIIKYNIPNTVPGEYVETRIAFPENLVKDAQITDKDDYLETVLQEEKEYSESDKSDLLKARENAAKEAGKKAWNEKMKQRIRVFSTILSVIASISGIITIYRTKKELQANQEATSFELNDIPQITPQEAHFLLSGKTGARGILGGLFGLASKGFIKPEFINESLIFKLTENHSTEILGEPEKDLLKFVYTSSEESGEIDLLDYISKIHKNNETVNVKENYIKWEKKIKRYYSEKNKLTAGQLYYRNLGLIMGVILFAAGCIVSVTFSVLSAYLMLPVGFMMFWYSLSIERRTSYSIARIKVLKKLKELIIDTGKKQNPLPSWANDSMMLLAFSLAIGVENNLHLREDRFDDEDICSIGEILDHALITLNNSLSAILDD
ncbi:MAG: DUF2207 domain-containing protein [Clostridiaceae bacterium]|nr:DUF2207 domain-containing protein [Clostridiaceae bacterium]